MDHTRRDSRWSHGNLLAHDPVLVELAHIAQAADTQGELDAPAAAQGLQLISHGFPLAARDDDETVVRAAFVYDVLYASIKNNLELSPM